MTLSTSAVATCCSSASSRSRVSLATSVSWLVADKLWLRSFGALRRFGARRVGGALERRLIVAPEGSASYRAKISPRRGGLHSWIDQLNGWHMSALGSFATEASSPSRSQCPLCLASSTGRRNTSVKSLCWGFKSQGLAWSLVELACHFVQMGL